VSCGALQRQDRRLDSTKEEGQESEQSGGSVRKIDVCRRRRTLWLLDGKHRLIWADKATTDAVTIYSPRLLSGTGGEGVLKPKK